MEGKHSFQSWIIKYNWISKVPKQEKELQFQLILLAA